MYNLFFTTLIIFLYAVKYIFISKVKIYNFHFINFLLSILFCFNISSSSRNFLSFSLLSVFQNCSLDPQTYVSSHWSNARIERSYYFHFSSTVLFHTGLHIFPPFLLHTILSSPPFIDKRHFFVMPVPSIRCFYIKSEDFCRYVDFVLLKTVLYFLRFPPDICYCSQLFFFFSVLALTFLCFFVAYSFHNFFHYTTFVVPYYISHCVNFVV